MLGSEESSLGYEEYSVNKKGLIIWNILINIKLAVSDHHGNGKDIKNSKLVVITLGWK